MGAFANFKAVTDDQLHEVLIANELTGDESGMVIKERLIVEKTMRDDRLMAKFALINKGTD
jgi:hypothetical protein